MKIVFALRQCARAGILLGLAAYLGWLLYTGNIANYVNVRVSWLIAAASVTLCALGLRAWFAPDDGCCDHGRGSSLYLALLLPLALGFGLPSKPLGAGSIDDGDIQRMLRESIDMSMVATADRIRDPSMLYNPMRDIYPEKRLSSDDPLRLTILDWLRVYTESAHPEKIEGEPADVVGFVLKDPSVPDGFLVTRFFMRHCMFDTIPVALAVRWHRMDRLRDDAWVRVRGRFAIGTVAGKTAPVLVAESVKPVGQPEIPYLYPQAEE